MRGCNCIGIWLSLLVAVGVCFCGAAWAQEQPLAEKVLTLAQPRPTSGRQQTEMGSIENLLADAVRETDGTQRIRPLVYPDEGHSRNPGLTEQHDSNDGLPHQAAIALPLPAAPWGSLPGQLPALWHDIPVIRTSRAQESVLIDPPDLIASAGDMVANTMSVYSRLEILVDKTKFTLRLLGYRKGKAKLIYETRVGLGSPDFPTPTGKYVICRIFDDNPLWIPPQDRWWAWGESPSHDVYGGHMMPFFKKYPVRGTSGAEADDGPDKVAPRMKMVDAGMYRIHGTNSPWSVGGNQSHGCVRMLNKSVAELAHNLKLYAGVTYRGTSPNGTYVDLARPVTLILR